MIKVLAYDLGASSGRAIIGKLGEDIIEIEEIHRFPNNPVKFSDHLQWDFLNLVYEIKQGIGKCKINGNEDIESIGVDTWGVDFGLLDSNGNLLANPYHYRDIRTINSIEKMTEYITMEELFKRTGIQIAPFNTIYQLHAMKEMNDNTLDLAKALLMIPDLINYSLTGKMVSEYTNCTNTQLFNYKEQQWDFELIEKLNIPKHIFTDIVKPGSIIGQLKESICEELNINSIPVVAVASHDTASAVVSVPAEAGKKYAYISSGTWSLLGVERDYPIVDQNAYKYNFTNEGSINNKVRLQKNIMGLWIMQECRREWTKIGMDIEFDELVKQGEQSKPFYSFIDPDNEIFYQPGKMPDKIRTYCRNTGQAIPETIGEIVRVVEESLALKYRWAIEKIEEMTGEKIEVIHIVGGGSQDQLLCQFTANATNKTVISGPVEATALGNIIVQGIALGKIKDVSHGRQIIRNSFNLKTYKPRDTAIWDKQYNRFIEIIKIK